MANAAENVRLVLAGKHAPRHRLLFRLTLDSLQSVENPIGELNDFALYKVIYDVVVNFIGRLKKIKEQE